LSSRRVAVIASMGQSSTTGECVGGDLQIAGERLALKMARVVVALAQDRRGMDRRDHDLRELAVEQPATLLGDPESVAQQGLAGRRAQDDERLGADLAQLGVQPGTAGADL